MLAGRLVVLRSPLQLDEEFLYKVRNDFVAQNLLLALPRANSMSRVRNWFERILDDPQSVFFVAATVESNEPIGFVQIRKMDFVHGMGELGIFVGEAAHGKGIALEMLGLLENYVRHTFNLRKITLEVLAENKRAVRFYEKLDYSKVGVFKKHFYHRLEYHDVLIMEKFLLS
jgi:RimJ/RimL family protein N-acetyltransferase